MFSFLPRDMLFEMISYLTPFEYKALYLSVNQLTQMDLKQYTIICKTMMSNELKIWFRQNDIHVQSHYIIKYPNYNLSYYLQTSENWLTDGLLHSENDKPALIETYSGKIVQFWYQHGVLHRADNKPAVISFKRYRVWFIDYCAWFVNGLKIKEMI